eukprot:Rhum_TRINITY_DN5962_c0_g1::Rhum_TRINITY_DN5962_c0_g1_i1::g.18831::m.18831
MPACARPPSPTEPFAGAARCGSPLLDVPVAELLGQYWAERDCSRLAVQEAQGRSAVEQEAHKAALILKVKHLRRIGILAAHETQAEADERAMAEADDSIILHSSLSGSLDTTSSKSSLKGSLSSRGVLHGSSSHHVSFRDKPSK